MFSYLDEKNYENLLSKLKKQTLQWYEDSDDDTNLLINELEQTLHDFSTLKSALDRSIILAVTNGAGQILYVNEKFKKMSGYSHEELVGKTHRVINSKYHEKSFFAEMWSTIKSGEIWEGNIRNQAKDGSYYWVKTSIIPFLDQNKKPYMYVALRTDITKWKENEEKLLNVLKNDFNLVVNTMSNLIFKIEKDDSGEFLYSFGEGLLAKRLNFTTELIYGKRPGQVLSPDIEKFLIEKYETAFNSGETIVYDYSYRSYRLLTTLTPIVENGEIIRLIGCTNDITELHKTREKIEYLAFHDSLTGLANRKKCIEDVEELIANHKQFSIFILELNRFKFVSESLGHSFTDELMQHVAVRLRERVWKTDCLYRFSESGFIIIHDEMENANAQSLFSYSKEILDIFKEKFRLKDMMDIYVTGNIGISIYPHHGNDFEKLTKNADTALGVAKKLGKNAYKIYDEVMSKKIEKNLEIETYLETAIPHNELQLFFQPKLNLQSNEIHSMEALLRWQHPKLGNVSPGVFIPIAEETGVIWKIDEWVLERACKQNKIWNETRNRPLRVAVNISAMHFSHPDFVDMVAYVLNKTDLSPELLELEITETTILNNPDECALNVSKLREMGVTVSIDDFGTGYTSLNYLRKFTFDYLKIDRSYVKEMIASKEALAIIKTIIELAHELELKVIAEGVEEESTLQCLKQIGCDEIQGYYISRPVPKDEFESLLRSH